MPASVGADPKRVHSIMKISLCSNLERSIASAFVARESGELATIA
jgi:hypothetical protein